MITVFVAGLDLRNAVARAMAGNWSLSEAHATEVARYMGCDAKVWRVGVVVEVCYLEAISPC